MLKRIIIILLILLLGGVIVTWLHFVLRDYSTTGDVHLQKVNDGYELFRNGQPFYINGAGTVEHLRELADAGGNCVRTWDTTNLGAILDSAHKFNLAVIVGLPVVGSKHLDFFYHDKKKVQKQFNDLESIVNRYKNHPALLMWICGNELDFPYRLSYRPFYKAFNGIVDMIHSVDPNHPVTTSLTNFSRRNIFNILIKSPQLDLIAINTFGGQLEILSQKTEDFAWFWKGPFFLSEWSVNGFWEENYTKWNVPVEKSSTYKAERLRYIYNNVIPFQNKRMLGTCVFYWGNKQEKTHTWFSFFAENGAKTEAIHVMEDLWKKQTTPFAGPRVHYIVIDKNENHNSLFIPEQQISVELITDSVLNENDSIVWELLGEDWAASEFLLQSKLVLKEKIDFTVNKNSCAFNAPKTEGPYRLYAFVYDDNGFVATVNKPIYVLEHEE